jgi:hypothetical protein
MNDMNPKTETENDFECPPLPVDLQAQVDQLLARREALSNTGKADSDEFGELLIEAEKISGAWRESCEARRREKSALAQSSTPAATSSHEPVSIGSSQPEPQPKTRLQEYVGLKAREEKGDVPAGSAVAFWQKNQKEIQDDRESERDSAFTYNRTGGAIIRKLKQ